MNSLIRYDIDLKKLFTNIQKLDIIEYLFSLLGTNEIIIENYVLINILNFMKEIDICKKYSNRSLYSNLFYYFNSKNFNLNKLENAGEELNTFVNMINLFTCLFSNSIKKSLDIEITVKLFIMLFEYINEICEVDKKTNYNEDKLHLNFRKKYSQLILSSIINLINSAYISNNTDIDLLYFINNFFVQNTKKIGNYIYDPVVNKILIIFLNELTTNLYHTKIEHLPSNFEIFLENLSEILQKNDHNNLYFLEKINETVKLIKEKFKLFNSNK